MTEDTMFNAFLREKLEEGIRVPEVRDGGSLSFSGWRRRFLLAASLAVVCGGVSWQVLDGISASRERFAVQAMELLNEADAIALNSAPAALETETTFAGKLLAWQDAPFREIEF